MFHRHFVHRIRLQVDNFSFAVRNFSNSSETIRTKNQIWNHFSAPAGHRLNVNNRENKESIFCSHALACGGRKLRHTSGYQNRAAEGDTLLNRPREGKWALLPVVVCKQWGKQAKWSITQTTNNLGQTVVNRTSTIFGIGQFWHLAWWLWRITRKDVKQRGSATVI